jgi:outer membrane protein TolC
MHRFAVAGLLPVLFTAIAGAQSSPSIITEADFLSALDEAHPAVLARQRQVADAQAEIVAASTLTNPQLGVVSEDPSGPVRQLDVLLSWQLPRASRGPEIHAAEREADVAEAQLSEEVLALRIAMRQIYAEWAVSTARSERLAAQSQRVAELADRERSRAQMGETSGLEAHQLTLATSGLRSRLALAEAAAMASRAAARIWRSDIEDDAIPVLPSLPTATDPIGNHPRMDAALAELAAANLASKAAGRYVLLPELVGGWQRQEVGPETFEGPVLGLAWAVPVFARNQAQRSKANARTLAAEAELEMVRREVEAERAGALAAYRHLAKAAVEAAKSMGANERMLTGALAAFSHGEADVTDLLATLRLAFDSDMTSLDLHDAALAAHRKLERVVGRALESPQPIQTTQSTSQGAIP